MFHIASPYILAVDDPQTELVDPALKGSRNMLKHSLATPPVTRVVRTSSCEALGRLDLAEQKVGGPVRVRLAQREDPQAIAATLESGSGQR